MAAKMLAAKLPQMSTERLQKMLAAELPLMRAESLKDARVEPPRDVEMLAAKPPKEWKCSRRSRRRTEWLATKRPKG